jgi:hypothetical protein
VSGLVAAVADRQHMVRMALGAVEGGSVGALTCEDRTTDPRAHMRSAVGATPETDSATYGGTGEPPATEHMPAPDPCQRQGCGEPAHPVRSAEGRLAPILKRRAQLGFDAFVFGAPDGEFQDSFKTAWESLLLVA